MEKDNVYDKIKLGLLDRLGILNARRTSTLGEIEEIKQKLLDERKIKIATRDAKKLYNRSHTKSDNGPSINDFIENYLIENGLKEKALPEPDMSAYIVDLKDRKKINDKLSYIITNDGKHGIEYYNPDNRARFAKGYDTTRIVSIGFPKKIDGHDVCECMISWYDMSQVLEQSVYDKRGVNGDFNKYTKVLAEIDMEQLNSNPEYTETLMNALMNKNRVENYVNSSLQENPDIRTGRYIGKLQRCEDGTYGKVFDTRIGEITYNLPEMVQEREQRKINRERAEEKGNMQEKTETAEIER